MKQVRSKNRKLNLKVRSNIGATVETDMAAASAIDDEDLAEVAAYGRTSGCICWREFAPGTPGLPGVPGTVG